MTVRVVKQRRPLFTLPMGIVVVAIMGAASCAPSEGLPSSVGAQQRRVVGMPVRTVRLPSEISCPADDGSGYSHVAISVTVVPAGVLAETPALPADKALLATSCRNSAASGGSTIHFIDPGSNDPDEKEHIPERVAHQLVTTVAGDEGFPRFGWGSFAFRGDVDPPDLLGCSNPASSDTRHAIYKINLTTGVATKLFDAEFPTPGKPFCDGLAWDSWNDTIWMSPDISAKAYHYINRDNSGERLDLPSLDVPPGCQVNGSGNSGIAVVGPELFLACNGEGQIFRIRQSDHATVGQFPSGAGRAEDLECDGFTFASGVPMARKQSVLWTKDAFDPYFLSFEVPPGTCGLCRQAQRRDLNDDLTGPQRTRLFELLTEYINTEVLDVHARVFETGTWHGGNAFFSGHRGYIGGFEVWLLNVANVTAEERALFVPLPKWTPEKPVPPEFEGIDPDCKVSANVNCPGLAPPDTRRLVELPVNFKLTDPNVPGRRPLCEYASLEEIRLGGGGRPGLENEFHSEGHCSATGGLMCNRLSPGAPIFWPWHALLDDIAREYECACRGSCNTCTDIYQPPSSAGRRSAQGIASAPIGFWWWFEDEVFPEDLSPSAVVDHSGLSLRGVVRGGARLGPGLVGQALHLDGRDDYVEVSENSGNVGTSDFTLDAWIKTTEQGIQPIVEKSLRGRGYGLFLEDGHLAFTLGTGRDERLFLADTVQIADDQWHHIAAVVSRSEANGSGLYVDGQLVLTFDATDLAGDATNQAQLLLGRARGAHRRHHQCFSHRARHGHHPDHHHPFFKGDLDEVSLVRHALSKDLIASIFVARSAGKLGSAGNLPTSAEQPLCVVGLEEKVHGVAHMPEGAPLEALYHQVVEAIEGDNQRLARLRLRQLRDQSLVGHEEPTFLNVHFHALRGHADRCLGLPRLRLH